MSVSENKKKEIVPIVDEVAPFGAKELNKAVDFFRRVATDAKVKFARFPTCSGQTRWPVKFGEILEIHGERWEVTKVTRMWDDFLGWGYQFEASWKPVQS